MRCEATTVALQSIRDPKLAVQKRQARFVPACVQDTNECLDGYRRVNLKDMGSKQGDDLAEMGSKLATGGKETLVLLRD